MLVHVAVADPLAHYADEVTSVLRSRGVSAEAPADLSAWADDNQVKIVLLTLATVRDWERLTALRMADDGLLVVALMEVTDQAACAQALAAGAVSILPRGASAQAVLEIVGALARGESVLPTPLLRALAQQHPHTSAHAESPCPLSTKELGLAAAAGRRRHRATARQQRRLLGADDVPDPAEPLPAHGRQHADRGAVPGPRAGLDLRIGPALWAGRRSSDMTVSLVVRTAA
jgi:DNA-binding NarL/FixJ family response regulator